MDVIQRLEPVIIEIERERECVCVVAHQAILRALYGYFMKVPLAVSVLLPTFLKLPEVLHVGICCSQMCRICVYPMLPYTSSHARIPCGSRGGRIAEGWPPVKSMGSVACALPVIVYHVQI